MDQIKILTARRAYEFRPDDLRLTMLSVQQVQELIKQSSSFQIAAIGGPMPTFGPVPPTIPPGLVFNFGAWMPSEDQLVPIRFLHIEPRRIVIDVAGPSSAIDAIFARLRDIVAPLAAPDGTPAIGAYTQVLDYSEITAYFPFAWEALFAPPVRDVFARAMHTGEDQRELVLAPTLYMQARDAHAESAGGIGTPDSRTLQFAPRAGTKPEERVYFSGVPLDSDAHLTYLEKLEAALLNLRKS